MKKILSSLLFVALIFFFPQISFAQDTGWVINTFRDELTVEKNGEVKITELIAVDFNTLEKHGMYRDIPYVYESNGKSTYTDLIINSIMQDGSPVAYHVYDNGTYKRIQIGDSNHTISGKHAYVLTYTEKGILRSFTDHDELYWNITGNNWSVPIQQAVGIVHLLNAPVVKTTCYEGILGSSTSCTNSIHNGDGYFFSERRLEPGEGLSIVAGYKKGSFPILVIEKPKSFFEQLFSGTSSVVMLLLSVLSVGFVMRRWYTAGRDSLEQGIGDTVVVEYTPPEKLRPAEIGVLMDEKADTLDVTATVIDLTTRGYMTITQQPKKWLFGKTDYLLKRTKKNDNDLLPYESLLLDRLFADEDETEMSNLKDSFYTDLKDVKKALYKDMMDKKLFIGNPESIRNTYLAFGIIIIVIGGIVVPAAASAGFVYIADIAIAAIISGIALLFVSRSMARRSAQGHELYRRVKGYREFIDHVEQYRQKFFEKENMFNEVLPYTIVFGLTKKFADAMKDMGVQNIQPYGYYGLQPFSASTFTSSVNTFSNSFSSAIAATPSSSGGFSSGGGFSGGGFGGGGGGSW